MNPQTPLIGIYGIGPVFAKKLEKLGLLTLNDLIHHYPYRYDDFSKLTKLSELQIGERVTIVGDIWQIKNAYTRFGKVITKAILNDGTSSVELTWFNQPYLTKSLKAGDRIHVAGIATKYGSKLNIIAPDWEKQSNNIHTGRLVPVYPETAGVSSKWLRTQLAKLTDLIKGLPDFLPSQALNGMLPLSEALFKIHFPENEEQIEQAQKRLAFDELFIVQLATIRMRRLWQTREVVESWDTDEQSLNTFYQSLPFELTAAQLRVIGEATVDLKKQYPMNRLLQGEVGSGKTVVAAALCFLANKQGLQSLLMAPTEILAFQHHQTLTNLLKPHGIDVAIYTGSRKFSQEAEKTIPDIIVGTHALLSDKLDVGKVGLVIIDEQHRFGVEQRSLLRRKGGTPHFLTMTATPIPRTVALTTYGDLDLSIIDELPKNRPTVSTHVVPETKRLDAYGFIRKQVEAGDQVYIITPLIEESETLTSVKAVTTEYERLKETFKGLNLGLLHGRLKAKEKELVLEQFRQGEVQILVSTSVVEVGVDIPNATLILIEGANRFGLAQLHQLRGRVGRGVKASFCLLFTDIDKPEEQSRLKHLEKTFDGLKLAELDLKIRGAGTVFGSAQHGRPDFKIAKLTDLELIEKARGKAVEILDQDPSLDKYPGIKAELATVARDVSPD